MGYLKEAIIHGFGNITKMFWNKDRIAQSHHFVNDSSWWVTNSKASSSLRIMTMLHRTNVSICCTSNHSIYTVILWYFSGFWCWSLSLQFGNLILTNCYHYRKKIIYSEPPAQFVVSLVPTTIAWKGLAEIVIGKLMETTWMPQSPVFAFIQSRKYATRV